MKKFIQMLLVAMFTMAFTSCSKFHGTDVSVWAKGTWIVFWLPFVGGLIFGVLAYLGGKETRQPIYKIKGYFWFSVILLVLSVVALFLVNGAK